MRRWPARWSWKTFSVSILPPKKNQDGKTDLRHTPDHDFTRSWESLAIESIRRYGFFNRNPQSQVSFAFLEKS